MGVEIVVHGWSAELQAVLERGRGLLPGLDGRQLALSMNFPYYYKTFNMSEIHGLTSRHNGRFVHNCG